MEVPRADGLKPGKLIGYGGCGRVFHAKDETGADRVVKVFEDRAISRHLLAKMTARLETGGWPAGVMKVIAADFESEPSFWVMPRVNGGENETEPVPRNLQSTLREHPGTDSWKLVRSLARALARMHHHRVPHGNLKPGNVFLTDDGEVILSDWTLGNMPGVRHFSFTDAVLYQSPEQLLNPAGYLEEAGYRWDVFAFGVLAYRTLTGRFPRCHDAFHVVAPAPGETRKDGIKADLSKIARNLEAQPVVRWPDAPHNPLEAGFREWIDRCLPLDPELRPFSMMEVAAGFDALETKATADVEREALMDQRRRAERRSWRTLGFAAVAIAAAAVSGGLWQLAGSRLLDERAQRAREVQLLKSAGDAAMVAKVAAQADAESKTTEARQTLAHERELSLARLEASRLVGDRLFAWAMEKGNRQLPPLDGREVRLKQLENYFEDFLTRTTDIGTLADERARIRVQLSEISLAAGDAPAAGKRLGEALEAMAGLPMDAELKFRMATNSLLLALLRQSNADPGAEASFMAARKALSNVPQAEVDADRLNQLLAILDFHEAKILAAKGDDAKALGQLLRATQTLNRIADLRPDAAILKSELAACYLSSATILEGMGKLGDAREVRALASVELVKLLKDQPDDFTLRLALAGCYSAMAESAVLSGDIAGAESISRQAMRFLEQLVAEQPDNAEAVSRKASQLGLRAGIQRDRGFAVEALKDYEEGIRMLEALRASAPGNAQVSYRLALLWWQKGRMLGMAGQRDEEITLIGKARELLAQLESGPKSAGPRPEQLQSTGAYLLGDLGHALQLASRKSDAVQAFTDAVALWERLLGSRPQSEEYSEGLAWVRQRLADLK
jgi:eukaryotic-like serine/threonine-protein kinase